MSDATSGAIPMFQNQLMQFLDNRAPVLGIIVHHSVMNCFIFSFTDEE